jgi:hypothetical protein
MFLPCIIGRSRNNHHNAQICATALFYMLAPTCFGSSLPSSGSLWIRLSYVKRQIDMVVYHIMLSGLCIGVSWFSLLCFPAECIHGVRFMRLFIISFQVHIRNDLYIIKIFMLELHFSNSPLCFCIY